MPGKDREGPVELFGENDASEFVWKSHGTEREQQSGLLTSSEGPAISRPNREDDELAA
jgi:hypothetical protein